MQVRTIIDGQQRLTTLQLLLDALHAELLAVDAKAPAMRIEPLITNAEPFCSKPEDRFKVWPTNRDQPAFNAVMGAKPPVDYGAVGFRGARIIEAHRFFSKEARLWLSTGEPEDMGARAAAIETVVRDLLQIVVIDLAADENAQEIFETLNAQGERLRAADLIKNFIFQRLLESGAAVGAVYQRYWKDFETAFWETEVSVGRVPSPRSSSFFNHWLVARTGEVVVAHEVFSRFKKFADSERGVPMTALLEQVHDAAVVYRQFVTSGTVHTGPVDRLGLFVYRTGVLESEVIKPLLMHLLDPQEIPLSQTQLYKALEAVESWMVRRMLVRATTKTYNQVVSELIKQLKRSERAEAGEATEKFLASQASASRYWPDNEEILTELRELLAYRRLGRGRLRMVLEAIEDHKRGWKNGSVALGGERVARGKLAIEHVMPRKWATRWPPPNGADGEAQRDRLIHTIGNLTLLTGRLNSKVSNGPWLGSGGKRAGLQGHDVLFLNREVVSAEDSWTEKAIRSRTDDLAKIIVEIWPIPAGHRSGFAHEKARPRHKVDLLDLLNAGLLEPGMPLFPRRKKYAGRVATLLPNGHLKVDGTSYPTPSEAAATIRGKSTNGLSFFLVDQASKRSLRKVWREYDAARADDPRAVDVGDDDADEDGDEEDV